MSLHVLLVIVAVFDQLAVASRIDITVDETTWSSTGEASHRLSRGNASGKLHAAAHQSSKHHEAGHRASLLHRSFAEKVSATLGNGERSAHDVEHIAQSNDQSPRMEAGLISVVFIVGVCACMAYRGIQRSPRQDLTTRQAGKDGHPSQRSSVSEHVPSSSGEPYKDKDTTKRTASGAEAVSSSDDDNDGRPSLPEKVAEDPRKQRFQEIEQAAKCLATTCKKMPLHPGALLGGGAKERYIAMKPLDFENGASWSTMLKAWRKGKLGYWVDEKAFKAGQDPKGTINLLDVTKVTIPDKHMEQVLIKFRDGTQDGHLTLQFKDYSTATAWRDTFKELRSRL